jgi:hypothetical protein
MSVCFKILGQNRNILVIRPGSSIQATFIYNANLHGKCELYYENGLSPPGEREKVQQLTRWTEFRLRTTPPPW